MSSYDVIVTNDTDVVISPEPGDDVQVVADFEVEVIQVPEQGPPGPQGTPGTDGTDGSTVLYGSTDPVPSTGDDGDFYINTTSHYMFGPKVSGFWPTGTSLVGPIGPPGTPGNTILYGSGPPSSATGVDGNFYIDTTAHFLYGPKAGGVWPAGTSLIGQSVSYVGDTPPAGVADNTLWWNTTDGQLYLYYNDGNSKQWVAANPQPDPSTFLLKTGDTMTGTLTLAADPTTNLQAATKQYADKMLPLVGGTVTGAITLPADPSSNLQASTKQYVDAHVGTGALRYDTVQSLTPTQQAQARANDGSAASPVTRTRSGWSGGSGSYTPPTGCKSFFVRGWGSGGGGAGGSPGGTGGGNASPVTFGALTANGGAGGGAAGNAPAVGGTASGGDYNMQGNPGVAYGPGGTSTILQGPPGGSTGLGGAGYGGWPGAPGAAGQNGSGSGGGGGGGTVGGNSGAAGGYFEKLFVAPFSAPYAWAVGPGGTAGLAGTGTSSAGGLGGTGVILVDEYY